MSSHFPPESRPRGTLIVERREITPLPSESLWQLAACHMQPPIARDVQMGPFLTASVPSPAMALWAAGYVAVTLVVALRLFQTRDL